MKMKYMGNYAHFLKPTWTQHMLTREGERRPNDKMSVFKDKNKHIDEIVQLWTRVGYVGMPSVEWHMYYWKEFDETPDWSLLDFAGNYQEIFFWCVRLMPGKFFPGHVDRYEDHGGEVKRYWMAMEDYHWGHIFIHDAEMLHGYKAGDVFELPDLMHGAGNIGLDPKLSLQIMVKR